MLHQPGMTSAIVGVKRMEQLEDNLGAARVTVSEEERERLDTLAQPPLLYPQGMIARQNR